MKIIPLIFLFITLIFQSDEKILKDITAQELVDKIESFEGEKPVLLNVWATWCAPCIEEFPYLLKLNEKYEDEFELILVSGDFKEARDEAVAFLKKQGVDFETYFKVGKDNEFITTVSEKWTGALPFTIVYNKEGEVSALWEGKADLETFEQELLKVLN